MGLDFTSIKDSEGVAVYILHNSSVTERRRFENMRDQITQRRPDAQVVLLDISEPDAEQVRDFYDIMPESLPAVLLVADDDTVKYQWQGNEIPAADVVCHYLSQLNG